MSLLRAMTKLSHAFRPVFRGKINQKIDVSKYVSDRTGMTVTIADVEGPQVNGFFTLATEAHDDDGLPHTLEHLTFLGSEDYPFKGILDQLANRCLADGTNAWTAQDHTSYTIATAGQEGFLMMLPVYLDHILHPILTESGYVTEVHHVNGAGEDAGVVYCEMQAHESVAETMVSRELQKCLFPLPCGYGADTGGRLLNLRTSCSYEKVKRYHEQFYNPRNLNVIIAGLVEHEAVFRRLASFDDKLSAKHTSLSNFTRPFSSPVAPLTASIEKTIVCPADDETKGLVSVGWHGPLVNDWYEYSALGVLMEYLSDSAVSPLQREFVQSAQPLCSEVSTTDEEQTVTMFSANFTGTDVARQADIPKKLFTILEALASGDEPFDMKRMRDVIHNLALHSLKDLEVSPHHTISEMLVGQMLYGKTDDNFHERLNPVQIYEKLKGEPKIFWQGLTKRWLCDNHRVVIIGHPSSKLIDEMSDKEDARIEEQKTVLGSAKLKSLEERLQQAVEENDKMASPEVLSQFLVSNIDNIRYFPVKSSSNLTVEQDRNERFPLSDLPFTVILDDVKTNFVKIKALLDTSRLTADQRVLLPLLIEMLFESPMLKDGVLVPYEQVVTKLNEDVLEHAAGLGVSSDFERLMYVCLKVSADKYSAAVEWLHDLLYRVQYTEERIRVCAQKIIGSSAADKQEGYFIVNALLTYLNSEPGSNPVINSTLRQEQYLMTLLKRLDSQPNQIVEELKVCAKKLAEHLIVHIMCDTVHLQTLVADLHEPWKQVFSAAGRGTIYAGNEPLFLRSGADAVGRGCVTPVGACESAFLIQSVPSIRNRQDAELPALMLFCNLVSQLEGPLWRRIRGTGLAYGASVVCRPDSGTLELDIYRSTNPVKAYSESKDVIESVIKHGSKHVVQTEFEAAKGSLVYEIVGQEATVSGASEQSLMSYFRGVPAEFRTEFLHKIWTLEKDEVMQAGAKHVLPLFDWSRANTAIACHPSKKTGIVKAFAKIGRQLEVIGIDDARLTDVRAT